MTQIPTAAPSLTARVADRFFRTRWLVRMPIGLYRAGFGFLFGKRLLMLEHTGRKSGARRRVVLEVLARPAPGQYVIIAGFAGTAQWYRNITTNPRVRVSTGFRRNMAALAEPALEAESAAICATSPSTTQLSGRKCSRSSSTSAAGRPTPCRWCGCACSPDTEPANGGQAPHPPGRSEATATRTVPPFRPRDTRSRANVMIHLTCETHRQPAAAVHCAGTVPLRYVSTHGM